MSGTCLHSSPPPRGGKYMSDVLYYDDDNKIIHLECKIKGKITGI